MFFKIISHFFLEIFCQLKKSAYLCTRFREERFPGAQKNRSLTDCNYYRQGSTPI